MILMLMKTSIFMLLIIMMLILLNFLFMKKNFKLKEKMSPYECGFEPINLNRLPFSLQFYLICIMFLIFDVEISLLLPLIKCLKIIKFFIIMNIMMMIILILIFGLLIEWKEGALKWFK
uniref:NADH-ubiquinone oxidoreductase chain 3 n=1 Tax=Diapriidae sp. ZJUH_2016010 TaxID=2491155 RepID=A0A3Q8U9Z3_9HYME|nr:NADH dehydrogenase subunit 3 [Diapriidae sp. ZJUH_2016010]